MEKATVSVLLEGSYEHQMDIKDIKELMLKKAEKKAIETIGSIWINQSLLFRGKMASTPSATPQKRDYYQVIKKFTPTLDKITNVYQQRFTMEATLYPVPSSSGVIVGVEGGYSLATFHILLYLKGDIPQGQQAFFIIAKKNNFRVGNYYQLVGIGKIYNVAGRMAQGEILSSNEEISKGDVIFLLHTKLYPLKEKKGHVTSSPGEGNSSLPVVKVHPEMEPSPHKGEPKEMK